MTDGRTDVVDTNPKKRKILQSAGLALTAGLLLVVGGFVGNAIADDAGTVSQPGGEDDTAFVAPSSEGGSGDGSTTGLQSPSIGIPAPRAIDDSGGGPGDLRITTSPEFINRCQGDIDGLMSGGTVTPGLAGFESRFLSPSFVLQSLNLRADADCNDPTQQFLVMETSWKTVDGLFQVWITQRESDEPDANILRDTWAEFWHNGYYFSVSAGQSYDIKTLLSEPSDGDDPVTGPLISQNGAEVRALLQDVVEELTGDAAFQCFYQQVEGGWDSLAGLGIGDPRGAVPSGFTESNVYAQIFEAPSSGCNVPANVQLPTSFNANWTDGRDGWLSFNVYQVNDLYAEEFAYGRSSDWNISWTDGTYQYELYGNRNEGGIGQEVLEAMAVAIDPAFYQSCRLVEREFTRSELAEAGIGWPETPNGYELTDVRASGSEKTSGCTGATKEGGVSANWMFEGEDSEMLNASAWTDGSGTRFADYQEGFISKNNIEWQSAEGTIYSVESWAGRDGGGDRDAMIALAKSLDPNAGIDSFGDYPGEERPPVVLPAGEDSAGSAEGGSPASE